MKNYFVTAMKSIITGCFLLGLTGIVGAQSGKDMTKLQALLQNEEYHIYLMEIDQMRKEGKTDDQIYNFLADRAQEHKDKVMKINPEDYRFKKNEKGEWVNVKTMATCTGDTLGVESGVWGNWTAETRCWTSTGGTGVCSLTPFVNLPLPATGTVSIINGGTELCANPANPLPLPSPFGGQYSIKLGNDQVQARSERISHSFIVQPGDAKFVYQYAAVFENPSSHLPADQPFFDFVILDANGDTIPCSYQYYYAAPGIPGFYLSNGCTSTATYYNQWTMVGVNLAGYIGTPVTVICTSADCALCGHHGYAYVDFSCGSIITQQVCLGEDSVFLAAPGDPTFTYQWSTGETTSSIIANPLINDTVTVYITQFGVCGFDLTFVMTPTTVSPAFIDSVSCLTGNLTIINTTTVTNGSVSNWQWGFPGGNPSSSNLQDPPPIYYPPGTYTVSLTTTTASGCTKTYTQTITVGTIPTANFVFSPKLSCEGITVDFLDQTANATDWIWDFGDGSGTSTGQSPSHIYETNGTYSVTLIAQFPPCADTLVQPVTITAAVDTLLTPNVFTPNNDTYNDCFKPIMPASVGDSLNDCIEMRIYDRWGIEVYESIGGLVCWDGKTKSNTKAKDGTYYYLIKFGESTYRGYVTLLRKAN